MQTHCNSWKPNTAYTQCSYRERRFSKITNIILEIIQENKRSQHSEQQTSKALLLIPKWKDAGLFIPLGRALKSAIPGNNHSGVQKKLGQESQIKCWWCICVYSNSETESRSILFDIQIWRLVLKSRNRKSPQITFKWWGKEKMRGLKCVLFNSEKTERW